MSDEDDDKIDDEFDKEDADDSVLGDNLEFDEDKIPDGEDKIPDGEDKIPDGEDKIPDGEDKIPDGEDEIPGVVVSGMTSTMVT